MTPNVTLNHTMRLKSRIRTFPLSIHKAHTSIGIDNSSLLIWAHGEDPVVMRLFLADYQYSSGSSMKSG